MLPENTNRARAALFGADELIKGLLEELDQLRSRVTIKSDDTPVTAADKLAQTTLEAYFHSQFTDLTFVGEEDETGWTKDPDGWVVVVDPIDGTENFVSSMPEWGTAISIFKDGVHAASMITLPELDKRIITGDSIEYKFSRITAFSSGINEQLVREISGTPQSRLFGAAVYNLFNVITGRVARFINPVGAYSWDLLAGLQLALEHGCEVTVDGEPYRGEYLRPGVKFKIDIRNKRGSSQVGA